MNDDDSPELDLDYVDIDLRAEVALDVIRSQRKRWARLNRRPPALQTRDAKLAMLHDLMIFFVANPLNRRDRERMMRSYQTIHAIVSEVIGSERVR